MKRTLKVAALIGTAFTLSAGALVGSSMSAAPAPPTNAEAIVYKSPTCGCCGRWVDHLAAAGYKVTARDTTDMASIKRRHGVPASMESCHTTLVGGYVVEGHVPAEVVTRLLREKPAIIGISAPGMPLGSPGMEGPRKDKYDVVTFDKSGHSRVYSSH